MQTLHRKVDSGITPWTFLLGGDGANHYATMLPISYPQVSNVLLVNNFLNINKKVQYYSLFNGLSTFNHGIVAGGNYLTDESDRIRNQLFRLCNTVTQKDTCGLKDIIWRKLTTLFTFMFTNKALNTVPLLTLFYLRVDTEYIITL